MLICLLQAAKAADKEQKAIKTAANKAEKAAALAKKEAEAVESAAAAE